MLNNRKKIIFAFVVVFLLSTFYFLFSIPVEAAEPLQLQVKFPCPDFPGAPCPATPEKAAESPAAYIARLYQFALAIAGMLAFGMIIYGAIQYTVSAGNVAQQSDAKDRITQALWGVALLLGAYLILHTIDPQLVSLKDPSIKFVKVKTPPPSENENLEKVNGIYRIKPVKDQITGKTIRGGSDFFYVAGTKCPDRYMSIGIGQCSVYGPPREGVNDICCISIDSKYDSK